ncbi:uncharacterized protein tut [Calliphora vicina]|uniref:uncharacterized protein tut n=1 Tax=Calliphora vicina TaxID=7373 RepID=UPI00325ABD8E
MSIYINAEMCSYVRKLFEHPSKWYESYQENGTKYIKRRKKLEDQLQQQLNACAGEIFLCGIPAETRAEKIAEVASLLGEVYILRFKVHFSGASRGFAYLQYIDPNHMPLALQKLPQFFRELKLPTIKVCESRNSSILLLRNTHKMTPLMVFETLKKLINFYKLVGHEIYHGYFVYQIVFKCNEEAVHARRELLKSILNFGPKAVIVWDTSTKTNFNGNFTQNERFYKQFKYPNQQPQNIMMTNTAAIEFQTNFKQQNIATANVLKNFANLKLH